MMKETPANYLKIVQSIDQFVKDLYAKGGGDEELLMNMQPYMNGFKKVLDHVTKQEMNAFCQQYDGFYRFAKFLEDLAEAIRDGYIEVPE